MKKKKRKSTLSKEVKTLLGDGLSADAWERKVDQLVEGIFQNGGLHRQSSHLARIATYAERRYWSSSDRKRSRSAGLRLFAGISRRLCDRDRIDVMLMLYGRVRGRADLIRETQSLIARSGYFHSEREWQIAGIDYFLVGFFRFAASSLDRSIEVALALLSYVASSFEEEAAGVEYLHKQSVSLHQSTAMLLAGALFTPPLSVDDAPVRAWVDCIIDAVGVGNKVVDEIFYALLANVEVPNDQQVDEICQLFSKLMDELEDDEKALFSAFDDLGAEPENVDSSVSRLLSSGMFDSGQELLQGLRAEKFTPLPWFKKMLESDLFNPSRSSDAPGREPWASRLSVQSESEAQVSMVGNLVESILGGEGGSEQPLSSMIGFDSASFQGRVQAMSVKLRPEQEERIRGWLDVREEQVNHDKVVGEAAIEWFRHNQDQIQQACVQKKDEIRRKPKRGVRRGGDTHVEISVKPLHNVGVRSIAFHPEGYEFPNYGVDIVSRRRETPHLVVIHAEFRQFEFISPVDWLLGSPIHVGEQEVLSRLLEVVVVDILHRIMVLDRPLRPHPKNSRNRSSAGAQVVSHLRSLPKGSRASEEARRGYEEEFGHVNLPEGYTFVQGYYKEGALSYEGAYTEPTLVYGLDDLKDSL